MSEIETEDTINPNSWTTKELVKYLYREMQEIHKNQQETQSTLKKLEEDMQKRIILQEQQEKRNKLMIGAAGVLGSVVAIVVKAVLGI